MYIYIYIFALLNLSLLLGDCCGLSTELATQDLLKGLQSHKALLIGASLQDHGLMLKSCRKTCSKDR